jgi:hypothetical protein
MTRRLLRSSNPRLAGVVLAVLAAAYPCVAAKTGEADGPVPATQTFALTDTKDLTEAGVKAEGAEYNGRKGIRLTTDGEAGFAFLKGTDFQDGTIEVDIATKVTTPPGMRMPGFTGIAFRAQDPQHYEMFYLRPKNSKADDQAMRNHSVQYVAEPGFGWEKLRRQWPFVYEAWTDQQPGEWTAVKIEVHGRQAKLYLNGSPNPSLIVDGMKGENLRGPIALWGYAGEESYFSNLRVSNNKPDPPVQNGGEAAGAWDVTFSSDAGRYTGTMKLVRQNGTLVGTWSGNLGPDQQVSGTWRDGYVELNFGAMWPEQPGTAMATMAGWVDGDQAGGRMKVDGRADGRWTAVRKKQ